MPGSDQTPGAALGDVDNDGELDMITTNNAERARRPVIRLGGGQEEKR